MVFVFCLLVCFIVILTLISLVISELKSPPWCVYLCLCCFCLLIPDSVKSVCASSGEESHCCESTPVIRLQGKSDRLSFADVPRIQAIAGL